MQALDACYIKLLICNYNELTTEALGSPSYLLSFDPISWIFPLHQDVNRIYHVWLKRKKDRNRKK